MKKFVLGIFILLLIIGCRTTDSIMFKGEYESLNNNLEYTKVSIPSENPFIYITDEELAKKLEEKQDMVVLMGYSKSNDTRNILSNLIKASNNLDIDTIYYLDILNIRDEKNINENGEIITTKEGSDFYKKILELLNDYLDEYIVNGEIVGTRIYAPSILVVKNKEIKGIVNGKSYLESPEEKEKESYNNIYEHLKKYQNNTCDLSEGC
ncbi:MAG: hypothetical protein IKN63_06910 [Bacilli bacterium]|nr:hypothetical protein [Bacilli bacterium]